MRLRDIIKFIDHNQKYLTPTATPIQNDNSNHKISNVFNMRSAVEEITQTKAFQNEIGNIRQFESFFMSTSDTIMLPKAEASKLVAHINQLKNKMVVFKSVAETVVPEQDELSISIKLPKVQDLGQLSEISSKLDTIFNQMLVNETINGNAILQNFDTGSEWVEIVFDSLKSLGLITSLAYMVILAKRELIKNEEAMEVVRNRRIANNLYEKMGEQLLQNTNDFIDDKIKEKIAESDIDENNHEYFERYKYCMSELTKLVDKGLQFFPSSKSPDEIKTTLPDFSKKTIKDMLPETPKIENTGDDANVAEEENQG